MPLRPSPPAARARATIAAAKLSRPRYPDDGERRWKPAGGAAAVRRRGCPPYRAGRCGSSSETRRSWLVVAPPESAVIHDAGREADLDGRVEPDVMSASRASTRDAPPSSTAAPRRRVPESDIPGEMPAPRATRPSDSASCRPLRKLGVERRFRQPADFRGQRIGIMTPCAARVLRALGATAIALRRGADRRARRDRAARSRSKATRTTQPRSPDDFQHQPPAAAARPLMNEAAFAALEPVHWRGASRPR